MSLVEYHDPDGLFAVVSPHLFARLPLRNLHWKSPSRPVRSIESIHVDFERAVDDQEHASTTDANGDQLSEAADQSAAKHNPQPPPKSRRHQIPGLRQTPFLKLYLLRCDDNDTYKASSRRLIREWLNKNSPASQSSSFADKQENHDAFEWLILHVVIPDTPAASQPRWSKKQSSVESEPPKEKSKSGWTGRGSSTILEKVRADFNHSSKSAPDRVAQVRLRKEDVPGHLLPALPAVGAATVNETPKEQENAWNDLISKLKTLILLSFTLRVAQYEEDVREKDAQRSLPGWNFNTFFLLKEGLAMAFESVGLTEDALLAYDELAVGLETTIHELETEAQANNANVFPAYTSELVSKLQPSREDRSGASADTRANKPLSSTAKNYRDRIVANKISLFDFRCYIFARQMSLLLRLARGTHSQALPNLDEKPSGTSDGISNKARSGPSIHVADVTFLTDLCRRGMRFALSTARLMKIDLHNGSTDIPHVAEGLDKKINAIISSWNFGVLQQLLKETHVPDLLVKSSVNELKPIRASSRKSPSPSRRTRSSPSPSRGRVNVSDPNSYEDESLSLPQNTPDQPLSGANAAIEDLAASRADILLTQRRILQASSGQFAYVISRRGLETALAEPYDEEDDFENDAQHKDASPPSSQILHDFYGPPLSDALGSKESLKAFYESLSEQAAQSYMLANRQKAAEKLNVDIAILRFNTGDYASAANHFSRILSLYHEEKWNLVESRFLELHAQCLKALNRRDEYVRTMLMLLARSGDARISNAASLANHNDRKSSRTAALATYGLVDTAGMLHDLVSYSRSMPYDVTVSTAGYFSEVQVDTCIRLVEEQDGFRLSMNVQQVLADELTLDSARIRLVSTSAGQINEIWVESTEPINLSLSTSTIWLSSNVTTNGHFIVDYVMFRIGRIVFVQETLAKTEASTPLGAVRPTSLDSIQAVKEAAVLCYPRNGAFNADVRASSVRHLGRPKKLCLHLSAGSNNIKTMQIALKSASAGLRLHTAESAAKDDSVIILDKSQPGSLKCGSLEAETKSNIVVPYDVENNPENLSVRLEIIYTTTSGEFRFLSNSTIHVGLAINVNVQDVFKAQALYSKFFLKPTSTSPAYIAATRIQSSDHLEVQSNNGRSVPTVAFRRQPTCISYKIRRRLPSLKTHPTEAKKTVLTLSIEYCSAKDELLQQIIKKMTSDIGSSQWGYLGRLIIPFLRDKFQANISGDDVERSVWRGYANIPRFDEVGWQDIMSGISTEDRSSLEHWLKEWHNSNTNISMPDWTEVDLRQDANLEQLLIDVDIPRVQYLHTTSLRLNEARQTNVSKTALAYVGEPLISDLTIRYTKQWDLESPGQGPSNNKASREFSCEVLADPAVWLVAGQRRVHFAAAEDEHVNFEIVLIPLKTGLLLLPTVDVKLATSSEHHENQRLSLTACETDFASQGQSVWVLEKMDSVTIGLGKGDQMDQTSVMIESDLKMHSGVP